MRFFAKFNRWHERNKEIYRSSFAVANNIYFHEYESQIWSHLVIDDIIKIYKEDIDSYLEDEGRGRKEEDLTQEEIEDILDELNQYLDACYTEWY